MGIPFGLSTGLRHMSSAPVRGSLERYLTGTLVRTSCCNHHKVIVSGRFHGVAVTGPNAFHVKVSRTVTNNVDSTEGKEVFGVFSLVGIKRHSKRNLYSMCDI